MSLRFRLILFVGTLVLVLVAAQWWLTRALSKELAVEVDAVALDVGQGVVREIHDVLPSRPAGGTAGSARTEVSAEVEDAGATVHERAQPGSEHANRLERIIFVDATKEKDAGAQGVKSESFTYHFQVLLGDEKTRETHHLKLRGPDQSRSVPIPIQRVEDKVKTYSRRLLAGQGALLFLGLMAGVVIAQSVTAPLRRLQTAARRLEEGELGVQVTGASTGEVGQTIRAFNRMSDRLEQFERQERRLQDERHLAELSEVARGLAHALRNPLNTVGLTVEELGRRASGPGIAELINTARAQISRIDGSLRSFLALSRAGRETAIEPVTIAALCRDVVLEALQSGGGRVSIDLDTTPAEAAVVRAVAAELRAAIHALLMNAVEATPDGGRVRVLLTRDAGTVQVEVEDEGPGLPEEVRHNLFQPHLTAKPNGCGMGLYLAHRIVSGRYGGQIRLDPRAPSGTRAVIALPCAREAS